MENIFEMVDGFGWLFILIAIVVFFLFDRFIGKGWVKKIKTKLLPNEVVLEEADDMSSSNPVDDDDYGDLDAYLELRQMGFAYTRRYHMQKVFSAHGVHFKRGVAAVVNHNSYSISYDILVMLADRSCIIITSNLQRTDMQFDNHQIISTRSDVATACQQLLTHLLTLNQPHIPITEHNFVQIYQDLYSQLNQHAKQNA